MVRKQYDSDEVDSKGYFFHKCCLCGRLVGGLGGVSAEDREGHYLVVAEVGKTWNRPEDYVVCKSCYGKFKNSLTKG